LMSMRHPVSDPLGRFDRPIFNGRLYNVGAGGNGPSDNGPKPKSTIYADVLFPGQPNQSWKWKNGGVIHNWGSGEPRIVVFGTSHAVMYAKLIDDVCEQEGMSVAFLVANGTSVFFPTPQSPGFPTLDLARDFDAARRKWLREWRPDATIVIDRW